MAYRVGLVVTPSSTPQRAAVRISSMSAVSRKIFIGAGSVVVQWVDGAPTSYAIVPTLRTGRRAPRMTVVTGPIATRGDDGQAGRRDVAAQPLAAAEQDATAGPARGRSRRASRSAPGSLPAGRRWISRGAPKTTPSAMQGRGEDARRRSPAASPCRGARSAPAPPMTGPATSATTPQIGGRVRRRRWPGSPRRGSRRAGSRRRPPPSSPISPRRAPVGIVRAEAPRTNATPSQTPMALAGISRPYG